MIEFINNNTTFISTISTVLLLLVTIVYVVVNTLMHSEMVKSREILQRADVTLRLEKINSGFMKIVIENNTPNDVYELSFYEYPEVMNGKNKLSNPGFIKEGITYMASKQSYNPFL